MGKNKNLSDSCAIVTGAAGGIGFSFCRELASRNCRLIMVDISEERLSEAADTLKAAFPEVSTYLLAADLTSADVVECLESFIKDNSLDPDILINNAGIFSFAPVTEVSEGKINCFVDLHVRAVTLLSRWMAARRMEAGNGWILNMSSMSCWAPMPGLSMYAATKAYIRVFTRSLHYDMKDYGVKVMAACPGGIATDLFGLPKNLKRLAVKIGAIDTPERFTHNAINKLLKGRQQYINGWLNRIAIFMVGITPTTVRMMVKHHLLDKGIKR
ncbi:MAG: SDR family NAD(P)-dependent oxidoreductase [Muribaculaceae bacterium]|nr:SDR family NAD(P)-dependent oxidoreductase [Muribaculaceae bacterium]